MNDKEREKYRAMHRETERLVREENQDPEFWRRLHKDLKAEEDRQTHDVLYRVVRRLVWIEKERCDHERYLAEEQL